MGITKWASLAILSGIVFLLLSCNGFFPSQSKPDVLHKSGLNEPFDSEHGCMTASCHGDSLRGGVAMSNARQVVAPSCYQCHGAIWENEDDDDDDDDDEGDHDD